MLLLHLQLFSADPFPIQKFNITLFYMATSFVDTESVNFFTLRLY